MECVLGCAVESGCLLAAVSLTSAGQSSPERGPAVGRDSNPGGSPHFLFFLKGFRFI